MKFARAHGLLFGARMGWLVLICAPGCASEVDDYRTFVGKLRSEMCQGSATCPRSPAVVEKCRAANGDSFYIILSREQDLIAGRAHFDAAAAQRCLDSVAKSPRCNALENFHATAICDAAVVGRHFCLDIAVPSPSPTWVEEGGSCTVAPDPCADGLYCNRQICVRTLPRGADCTDAFCEDGLTCAAGVCTPTIFLGGVCDLAAVACEEGTRCVSGICALVGWSAGDPCPCNDDGLYCSPKGSTCQKRVAEGESCDPMGDSCAEGTSCSLQLLTCQQFTCR